MGAGGKTTSRDSLAFWGKVIGLIVAGAALGFVMPWQALSKDDAAMTYETKAHAREVVQRHEKSHQAQVAAQKAGFEQVIGAIEAAHE